MFRVKDGKARRNTKPTTTTTTHLEIDFFLHCDDTDHWLSIQDVALLARNRIALFFSFSLLGLFVCSFVSFFLREYLALLLSLLLCCGVVVVSRPVWYYKDTRARATKWWKESEGRRKESIKAQKHRKRSCAHDTPSPLPLLPPFFLTCSRYSR